MDHQQYNLHGTAINICNYGVLICGASGIGKTELGLSLIDRGHKLIADDMVFIENIDNCLCMFADNSVIGYMHVRGIGFIDIGRIYNYFDSIMMESTLDLIIELVDDDNLLNRDLLAPSIDNREILGVSIPRFKLAVGGNRNLALLSEVIIKFHKDILGGYDSNKIFVEKYTTHK